MPDKDPNIIEDEQKYTALNLHHFSCGFSQIS